MRMDEDRRKIAVSLALAKLKKAKPDVYEFITKGKCKLVGFIPNVEYTMPDDREKSLDITYLHDFSQGTLLYWSEEGKFGFFVNASLKYDSNGLKGFTY